MGVMKIIYMVTSKGSWKMALKVKCIPKILETHVYERCSKSSWKWHIVKNLHMNFKLF